MTDPQAVLRLILALVIKNGGELRVKAPLYDSLDRARRLVVDFDAKKGDIVLRATSDFGRAIIVTPENIAWVKPPEAAPLERARVTAEHEAEKRHVPSDEELADMEERQAALQKLSRDAKEGKTPLRLKTVK